MSSPVDPIAIALAITRTLNAIGVEHTIGGSIASSFAGEPRSSIDIDVVVARYASDPARISSIMPRS